MAHGGIDLGRVDTYHPPEDKPECGFDYFPTEQAC